MKTTFLLSSTLFFLLFSIVQIGCASLVGGSTFVIQSEPPQAEVYAQVEGKKDRVKLGTTPLELSETQLAEQLKLTAESTQWIQFSFEKKEYLSRSIMIPSNRWGEKAKLLKIQLSPNAEQTTLARQIISHFFNAKKFAETKQFDQAHSEIDKVLVLDPNSTQALNIKAGVYYLEGNTSEAKKYYRQAIAIDPTSSDAIKMLEKIQNTGGGN